MCFFSVNFLRHLLQILSAFFRIFLQALRCFLCPLPMSHGEFSLHEPMLGHTGGDGVGGDGAGGSANSNWNLYAVVSRTPKPPTPKPPSSPQPPPPPAPPAPCDEMGRFASREPTDSCADYDATDQATCEHYAKYRNDGSVSPCNWLGNGDCMADYNERYRCPPPPSASPTPPPPSPSPPPPPSPPPLSPSPPSTAECVDAKGEAWCSKRERKGKLKCTKTSHKRKCAKRCGACGGGTGDGGGGTCGLQDKPAKEKYCKKKCTWTGSKCKGHKKCEKHCPRTCSAICHPVS